MSKTEVGSMSIELDPQVTYEVRCNQGDILAINTRLWWHSTVLPIQPKSIPSISYARDFNFKNQMHTTTDEEKLDNTPENHYSIVEDDRKQKQPMSNIDGKYFICMIYIDRHR